MGSKHLVNLRAALSDGTQTGRPHIFLFESIGKIKNENKCYKDFKQVPAKIVYEVGNSLTGANQADLSDRSVKTAEKNGIAKTDA